MVAKNIIGRNKNLNEPAEVVKYWLNELSAARKREKDFRKNGQRVIDIYEGKNPDEVPFNICYSNTETLAPALYSATPRPVVQRRFKDDDPLGKSAALAGQRVLEFLLDTNIEGYETFDQGMKSATLDGLLPGRGVTSVKYDAEEGTLDQADGAEEGSEPTPYKKSELVCIDARSWNRVFFGYAQKWSKVPWVAYEEYIDKEEAERLFGEDVAGKIVYSPGEESGEKEDQNNSDADERNKGERKTATIYQIWDREGGKKVRYISAQYPDGFLKVIDDPLQLTGFFNCPKPLMFLDKSNDLLPVAIYVLYENQAKELNRLTTRINRIVEALKARGVYDSELGDDLKSLMSADDNALVPSDKSSSLAAEKGLQNAIWFMPLDVLIGVLEKLYIARSQCKQVIYEITGISDIIRGSSMASETATAQKLKSQWGTLRLKPKQKEVQRYARDLLRMMLEIAATKFSEETWAKMTGLPFLLQPKFNELTAVEQALQGQVQQENMQQQMIAVQAQQTGQPAQPPAPSQSQQQLQQVMQQLQTPKWSDVLAMLKDDVQRSYRIDIETNSTVEPEAVEDQKNISEVMTALGQFLNGVTPLVVSGAMPFQAAQSMMLAIVRRFRFGTEIEDYVKQMQSPKPPDDGKAAAAQQQQQIMQAEQAKMQSDNQMAMSELQQKSQQEQAQLQAEGQMRMLELKTEMQLEQMKMQAQHQADLIKAQVQAEDAANKLQTQKQIEQMKANIQRDTALKIAALQSDGQVEIARINASIPMQQAETQTNKEGESAMIETERQAKFDSMMQVMMDMQNKLIATLAAPKTGTLSNGKKITIETATVQ